ncbi:MAG TPA: substrate-binding domain-containing protein [Candidatus Blautia faecavium]|uniref:Substrate-binding domain-containing protein n=1 Tax=Candidatus Blautia faecavium TaxID=2838487 RepID=A0A9D2RWY7_9FIRM|nr:substrate-binding domain-containing protein [Candidatus Blautia faecavium]
MKKKYRINKEIFLMLSVIVIALLFIFVMSSYYGRIMESAEVAADELNQVYEYQYEMIVDNRNLTFWQDVYDNAREEALKNGAVLELKGLESGEAYDKADYMDMSIAAQVDGIILEYNGEEGIQEKIDEAVNAGIPVVTIVNDATQSLRQSFVGINDYQLGQVYGAQVANLLDGNTERVLVLLNWEQDLGQNQLYAQINSAVEKKNDGKRKIKIQSRNIMSQSQFDTEEEIRNIFQDPEGPPQILVCMDEVTTECAYQAMIDYNMVGEVKIIGYYTSKTIMDAVGKGLIPVTLSMNVEQIGTYSIEALTEYWEVGRANSYYSVDLDVITEENWEGQEE